MTNVEYRALETRIAALEERLRALEGAKRQESAQEMLQNAALAVDKSRAAKMLGVTRTTIYAMIEDGRLRQTADGKVVTRSIREYMERAHGENNPYKRRGGHREGAFIRA